MEWDDLSPEQRWQVEADQTTRRCQFQNGRIHNFRPTFHPLRARGDGQAREYMQGFPSQARELGKEIAPFATSNAASSVRRVPDNGDHKVAART